MAMDDDMQTFAHKVRTNGDKIRAMNDEQLAEAISCKIKFCKVVSSGKIEIIKDCCPEKCYECALDWIRKEAEP